LIAGRFPRCSHMWAGPGRERSGPGQPREPPCHGLAVLQRAAGATGHCAASGLACGCGRASFHASRPRSVSSRLRAGEVWERPTAPGETGPPAALISSQALRRSASLAASTPCLAPSITVLALSSRLGGSPLILATLPLLFAFEFLITFVFRCASRFSPVCPWRLLLLSRGRDGLPYFSRVKPTMLSRGGKPVHQRLVPCQRDDCEPA